MAQPLLYLLNGRNGQACALNAMSLNSDAFKTIKKKKTARAPLEEVANRDGHWTREFSSRLEAWPIVEPWVTDHDFHMIAAKGKRRLYLKDLGPFAKLIVDIKQWESQITVSSWIELNFLGRVLSLFTLPREMFPYPGGVSGVRIRRQACRELNDLLERFRQAPILGSQGFHVSDLDITTLLLVGGMLLPFLFFGIASLAKFEIVPGLSNALLIAIGKYGATVLGIGAGIAVLHHFLAVKHWDSVAVKTASAVGGFLIYTTLTIILLTRTTTEMIETKVTHDCLTHYHESRCQSSLNLLPMSAREKLATGVQNLTKHLSLRPKP